MNLDLFILGGYGHFVWPSFIFAFLSCFVLYLTTKRKFHKYERMFLKENKHIKQAVVPVAVVGDHVMGVGPKTDGGFEDRMSQIADAHPGSPLASRYKSNESHAKIKARSVIEKHKKKRPLVT